MSDLYINQRKSFPVVLGSLVGLVVDFEYFYGITWVVDNDFILLSITFNCDVSRETAKITQKLVSKPLKNGSQC